MIKKEIFIGFLVGVIATIFGLVFAVQLFGDSDDWGLVIRRAIDEGFMTKLMSIGALLNLGAFFIFLKKKQDHRAKGVLIATVLVFLATMIIKYTS